MSVDGVLERLSKSVTFVVGATGALISKVEGERLADAVRHSMRDIDLGEDTAYLISDFPVTQDVLEKMSVKSISFLDDDLDRAEAFVLRELRMNCALLVPLVVHGRSWGLVEVYDMRLRRYSREDEAVAWFLVGQAGLRIAVARRCLGEQAPSATVPRAVRVGARAPACDRASSSGRRRDRPEAFPGWALRRSAGAEPARGRRTRAGRREAASARRDRRRTHARRARPAPRRPARDRRARRAGSRRP